MEEPNQKTTPSILIKFAELLGTEIKHGRLAIPEKYGKGYCAGFVFNKHLRMLINNYILNEDVIIENQKINTSKKIVFFKFQHIYPEIKKRNIHQKSNGNAFCFNCNQPDEYR